MYTGKFKGQYLDTISLDFTICSLLLAADFKLLTVPCSCRLGERQIENK